jgi:methionine synthase II (cobalamin-independent)
MPARLASAEITDPAVIAAEVTPAIAEMVRRQVEIGIDCIGDGEFWTARSLAHYTAHFTGIEARPVAPGEPPTTRHSTRERDEFPDFYGDLERAGTLFLSPARSRRRRSRRRPRPGQIEEARSHQPPARRL